MDDIKYALTKFTDFFTASASAPDVNSIDNSGMSSGLLVIVLVFLGIAYIIFTTWKASEIGSPDVLAVQAMQKSRIQQLNTTKEGFADAKANAPGSKSLYSELIQQLPENQRYLVNLQPLTGNLAGYVGISCQVAC